MAEKIIEVPGVGNVSFPDSMSDDDIAAAIRGHQSSQPAAIAAKSDDRTAFQVAKDQAKAAAAGSGLTGLLSPFESLKTAVSHPLDTAGAILASPYTAIKSVGESTVPNLVRNSAALVEAYGGPRSPFGAAPTQQENEAAAQGAGQALSAIPVAYGEAAALKAGAKALPSAADAVQNLKRKAFTPTTPGTPEIPLDAPRLNKWMGVASKEVEHGANPGQRVLSENLLGDTKQATKLNVDTALKTAGMDMQNALTDAGNNGVVIDAQTPVYDSAAQAVKRIGRPRDAAFQARVDGIIDDIESRYPDLNKLTPKDAHALQTELGDAIEWHGEAYNDPINKVMVRIYGDLNKSLKADVPGIGDLKSRWGDLYSASKNLKKSMARDTVGSGSGAEVPGPIPAVPPGPTPARLAVQAAVKYAPYIGATGLGLKAVKDYLTATDPNNP